ncbi:MAG TPA: LamG-like jellyroll fold domain-containing protein [Allosphingosinicella sp.]|nr:LamG-like jellyroll fold domain-containing protein [Allosphingosinicella sp.]
MLFRDILLTAAASVSAGLAFVPDQTGKVLALSTRNITPGYVSKAFDVKRSSDGTTASIYYLPNGDLDVATARAFRGTASVSGVEPKLWVTKWYNQNGTGDPTPVIADVVELVLDGPGGKPCLGFYRSTALSVALDSSLQANGADHTIIAVAATSDGTQATAAHIMSSYGADAVGWGLWSGGSSASGKLQYYSNTKGGASSATTTTTVDGFQQSYIVTRTSGAIAFYLNGAADGTATGHGNGSSTGTLRIGGQYDNALTSRSRMLLSEIIIYNRAISAAEIASISANHASYYGTKTPTATPAASEGASGLKFITNGRVSLGNNFLFTTASTWSTRTPIRMRGRPNLVGSGATNDYASIIWSSAASSPYPCHELWIDHRGLLRVRIINNIATSFLGVVGSINIVDDADHVVWATYDGSGAAAGVKLYVDGVLDTNTIVESDSLAGNSTTSPGPMLIGNQTGFTAGFFHRGAMSHHQFHNVVRDASYIAQYGVIGSIPALPDANIIGNYPMDEGSGTTVDDTSLSDFNGTLTTATWL